MKFKKMFWTESLDKKQNWSFIVGLYEVDLV